YTDLYDFAPVGYFSLDENGLILEVNLTGAALLGLERPHLTNRRFQVFVAPANRPAFHAFLERVFAGPEKQTCEASLMNEGHTAFWAGLEARSAITPGGGRKWCRVAVIEITARKEAEEAHRRIDILAATNRQLEEEITRRQAVETAFKQSEQRAHRLLAQSHQLQKKLRQVSHQILLVQENQRKEISRELHDKVCQLLVGINVHLAVFSKAAAIDPLNIRRTIVPLRRLVEKSLRSVHQFARELRPASLDDLGLIPALRSYIDDFPKRKGLQIQFAAFAGVEALDNDKRTVLYRVAQEALTNVAKHAHASVVKVVILKARGGVCLEISDDGKAFDVGRLVSAKWTNRLGLIGMRERVEMVGGRFSVVSVPGTGTTIRAELPFGKNNRRANRPENTPTNT
ncbi:MAG: PAS domain-containing sensor histidine kinase, partial [Verrucomicrobia bacterium]|nr:PAS domain-containing sensor histidine kinase [Verrucomicrobiota bacterium]